MKMLRDPLFWLIALFVALIFWLPYSQPLFAAFASNSDGVILEIGQIDGNKLAQTHSAV